MSESSIDNQLQTGPWYSVEPVADWLHEEWNGGKGWEKKADFYRRFRGAVSERTIRKWMNREVAWVKVRIIENALWEYDHIEFIDVFNSQHIIRDRPLNERELIAVRANLKKGDAIYRASPEWEMRRKRMRFQRYVSPRDTIWVDEEFWETIFPHIADLRTQGKLKDVKPVLKYAERFPSTASKIRGQGDVRGSADEEQGSERDDDAERLPHWCNPGSSGSDSGGV